MTRYFSPALRRRLAPVILLGGLLVLGRTAQTEMPRDQEVRLVLSSAQQNARTVRIAYIGEGEPLAAVEFHPQAHGHAFLVHTPSLKPGAYDMAIEIEGENGHLEAISRRISVPSEQLTIRLDESRKP